MVEITVPTQAGSKSMLGALGVRWQAVRPHVKLVEVNQISDIRQDF